MDLIDPLSMGLAMRTPSVAILSAHESTGGAARASLRLHETLLELGVKSDYVVQFAQGGRPGVIKARGGMANLVARTRHHLDLLPARLARGAVDNWATGVLPSDAVSRVNPLGSDIVHLHAVWNGFVSIQSLPRFNGRIVWTLHDMWPFTGGCTYDRDCGRFREDCGRCPVLNSKRDYDWSRVALRMRERRWRDLDITVVAPSRWLAAAAGESRVFATKRIEVIANPINLSVYRPLDKGVAREVLGLPSDRKIALFASVSPMSDQRKGFDLVFAALRSLGQRYSSTDLVLCIAGAWRNDAFAELGVDVRCLGVLQDDASMALAYSAADVFLAPSRQENLANTVAESLACGTPVVAFRIGGMPDMIDHLQNGYLVQPFDTEEFGAGIQHILESEERWMGMSEAARAAAERKLDARSQALKYVQLYRTLVN